GEVLASIGAGKQQAMAVAARLLELSGTVLGEPARTGPLVIRGNEGSSIQYASCCTPLPGDPVVAVLTKGQGIVLHRKDCANAKRAEADRQLEAEWDIKSPRSFSVPVAVMTRDERGALAGIALGISEAGANIESVMQDATNGEGFVQIRFRLQVESVAHLERVLARIEAEPCVERATRGWQVAGG
ncbi:ACT domain-containing protein, partial [Laribacter hongkongensis]